MGREGPASFFLAPMQLVVEFLVHDPQGGEEIAKEEEEEGEATHEHLGEQSGSGWEPGQPFLRPPQAGARLTSSPQTTPQAGRRPWLPKDSLGTSQDTQASFQGPGSPAKAVSPARLAVQWEGDTSHLLPDDNKLTLRAGSPGRACRPRSHPSPHPRHSLASAVWHVIQRGSDFS